RSSDISRKDWQLLNLLHEHGGMEISGFIEILKPFAGEEEINGITNRLLNNGIIEKDKFNGQLINLTATGENLHRQLHEKQKNFREKSMYGISENEYKATVEMLKKLVSNLT